LYTGCAKIKKKKFRRQKVNTCVSLMYELGKKKWKGTDSKYVGTGPLPYEKRIYRTAVPKSLRNTAIRYLTENPL